MVGSVEEEDVRSMDDVGASVGTEVGESTVGEPSSVLNDKRAAAAAEVLSYEDDFAEDDDAGDGDDPTGLGAYGDDFAEEAVVPGEEEKTTAKAPFDDDDDDVYSQDFASVARNEDGLLRGAATPTKPTAPTDADNDDHDHNRNNNNNAARSGPAHAETSVDDYEDDGFADDDAVKGGGGGGDDDVAADVSVRPSLAKKSAQSYADDFEAAEDVESSKGGGGPTRPSGNVGGAGLNKVREEEAEAARMEHELERSRAFQAARELEEEEAARRGAVVEARRALVEEQDRLARVGAQKQLHQLAALEEEARFRFEEQRRAAEALAAARRASAAQNVRLRELAKKEETQRREAALAAKEAARARQQRLLLQAQLGDTKKTAKLHPTRPRTKQYQQHQGGALRDDDGGGGGGGRKKIPSPSRADDDATNTAFFSKSNVDSLKKRVSDLEMRLEASEREKTRLESRFHHHHQTQRSRAWGEEEPSVGAALRHVRAVAASIERDSSSNTRPRPKKTAKERHQVSSSSSHHHHNYQEAPRGEGPPFHQKNPSSAAPGASSPPEEEAPTTKRRRTRRKKGDSFVYDLEGHRVKREVYLDTLLRRQKRGEFGLGKKPIEDLEPPPGGGGGGAARGPEKNGVVAEASKYPNLSLEKSARDFVRRRDFWLPLERRAKYVATLLTGAFKEAWTMEPKPPAKQTTTTPRRGTPEAAPSSPYFQGLSLWDCVVVIEAQPNRGRVQMSTRHDPARYEATASQTHRACAEQAQTFAVRFGGVAVLDSEKKTTTIGAFEVRLAVQTPAGLEFSLLHSKLSTGTWPSAASIQRRLNDALLTAGAPDATAAGSNPPENDHHPPSSSQKKKQRPAVVDWDFDQRPTLTADDRAASSAAPPLGAAPKKTPIVVVVTPPPTSSKLLVSASSKDTAPDDLLPSSSSSKGDEQQQGADKKKTKKGPPPPAAVDHHHGSPRLDFEQAVEDAERWAQETARSSSSGEAKKGDSLHGPLEGEAAADGTTATNPSAAAAAPPPLLSLHATTTEEEEPRVDGDAPPSKESREKKKKKKKKKNGDDVDDAEKRRGARDAKAAGSEIAAWLEAREYGYLLRCVPVLVDDGYDNLEAFSRLTLESALDLPQLSSGHAKMLASLAKRVRADLLSAQAESLSRPGDPSQSSSSKETAAAALATTTGPDDSKEGETKKKKKKKTTNIIAPEEEDEEEDQNHRAQRPFPDDCDDDGHLRYAEDFDEEDGAAAPPAEAGDSGDAFDDAVAPPSRDDDNREEPSYDANFDDDDDDDQAVGKKKSSWDDGGKRERASSPSYAENGDFDDEDTKEGVLREDVLDAVRTALGRSLEVERLAMEGAVLTMGDVRRLVGKHQADVVSDASSRATWVAVGVICDVDGDGSFPAADLLAFAREAKTTGGGGGGLLSGRWALWRSVRGAVEASGGKYAPEALEARLFSKYDPEARGLIKPAKFRRALGKLKQQQQQQQQQQRSRGGDCGGGAPPFDDECWRIVHGAWMADGAVDYVAFCSWLNPVPDLATLRARVAEACYAAHRRARKADKTTTAAAHFAKLAKKHRHAASLGGDASCLTQADLARLCKEEFHVDLSAAEARALRVLYAPRPAVDAFDADSYVKMCADGKRGAAHHHDHHGKKTHHSFSGETTQ